MCLKGLKTLVFRKILRTYLMDDPYNENHFTLGKKAAQK